MNINVNVTREDFLTYSKFACSRLVSPKPSNNKKFVVNLVTWFCLAFGFFSLFNHFNIKLGQFHWPSAILAATPFSLFAFYFLRNVKTIQQGSVPKENGLFLGNRLLEFGSEGFKDTCELGHSYYKWQAVQEIVSNNGNIYLFIDRLLAQIVPKSSFKDESEHNEFLEKLKKMHNQAINGTQ